MANNPQPTINAPCPECGRTLRTRQGLRVHLRRVHDIVDPNRECTRCEETKHETHFGVVGTLIKADKTLSKRFRPECDSCRSARAKARKLKRASRPESHKRRDNKKSVANTLGLTLEEYNTTWASFLATQGGKCAVCKNRPPYALDHCHSTGRLRGLLCRQCNLAAGFVGDDPEVAINLSHYLKVGQ